MVKEKSLLSAEEVRDASTVDASRPEKESGPNGEFDPPRPRPIQPSNSLSREIGCDQSGNVISK